MKKLLPRKRIIGAGAWIKRAADAEWERVGFLFQRKSEASNWARAEYPGAFALKVQSLRVVMTPRQPGHSWADVSAAKT